MAQFLSGYFFSCQDLKVSSGSFPTMKARKGLGGRCGDEMEINIQTVCCLCLEVMRQ